MAVLNCKCKTCGLLFHLKPSAIKDGQGKYCSYSCKYSGESTAVTRSCLVCKKEFKVHLCRFKRNPNEGKCCSNICRGISSQKESRISYKALHTWVRRHYGSPAYCEFCGKGREGAILEWANKSRLYKKEREDWLQLCTHCHKKYDKGVHGIYYQETSGRVG